jgi:hypothetical protein
MFNAASAAEGLSDRTDDPAGACLAAHYRALAHLTDPDQAQAPSQRRSTSLTRRATSASSP